jgi:hypothetical protein
LGVDDGRAVVPVLLNGGLAHMLLDTGAERSVISRAAAARLGLPFDPWVETTMRGAGGELETHRNADVQIATLGGVRLVQRATQPGLSLAVASFGLGGADGLLGGDILRHFTLDLDFPAGRMALRPARWAPPVGNSVPLTLLWPDLLLAPVRLDGQMLTALVDTGASASLVNARGLHRLGLTPAAMAQDQSAATAAIGGRLPVRVHRFSELRLGGLRIPAPWMLTAPVPEPAFDLILGLDILARQRIALSYASPRLTFSGSVADVP